MPFSNSSANTEPKIFIAALSALLLLSVIAATRIVTPAKDTSLPPLSIAQQGYFFAGGKYSTINGHQVMSGQLYAEFQIPARQTHPYPIVMVHGGGQSG